MGYSPTPNPMEFAMGEWGNPKLIAQIMIEKKNKTLLALLLVTPKSLQSLIDKEPYGQLENEESSQEGWPSGWRRRFAKPLYDESCIVGSNPIPSAILQVILIRNFTFKMAPWDTHGTLENNKKHLKET